MKEALQSIHKMKKAQLFSQPFIYIFIIFVIALLLIFGGRLISRLVNVQGDVEFNTFVSKLDKQIDDIYNLDYGSSVSLGNVVVPSKIKEICFLNLDREINYRVEDDLTRRLISVVEDKNIFFISDEETLQPRFNNKILVEDKNPLCVKVEKSSIKVRLTNKGNKVLLEKII
jgi:hypothetical protein